MQILLTGKDPNLRGVAAMLDVYKRQTLDTTPEHPFFTSERGWVVAGELLVGEHVRRLDGSWGVAVSYTHLDVYKRQRLHQPIAENAAHAVQLRSLEFFGHRPHSFFAARRNQKGHGPKRHHHRSPR